MFCLIWLLGGAAGAPGGAGEAVGWEGLEDEGTDGAEEADDDEGPLEEDEEEEEWLLDGGSFCGACFFGMVKLDLVTLSAPVMCTGPPWNVEGVGAEGAPGFLDFGPGLLVAVACFLVALELP